MSIPYKEKLLYTKPKESYPESVNKEIHLISFYPKGIPEGSVKPFGSYIYRMQKYAGDVDILETYHPYKKEITIIQQFIKSLKKIVNNLKNEKDHYFSEFKAGFDHEFDFSVGDLKDGIYYPNPELLNILQDRVKRKLITKDEYNYINIILNKLNDLPFSKKSMAYDLIYDIIREKRILRWTKKEILQGYKMIRGIDKYTLAEALRDDTIVKIDLIVLINNKFVEVTNIVSLAYKDKNGDLIPINIDDKKLHSIEGLQKEVEKLYYSNKFYSPLKMCKRMYSVCRQAKNYTYLENLGKILRGDISLLYQIKSEIDAFIILLERLNRPPLKEINRQMDEIKGRLNYVLDITNDQIIHISNEIDRIRQITNKKEKLEELKKYNKELKYIIEDLTINKMNIVHINPPPDLFLPAERQYARDIKREVGDRPTLEFKEFEENIRKYLREYNQQRKFEKEVRAQNQSQQAIRRRMITAK